MIVVVMMKKSVGEIANHHIKSFFVVIIHGIIYNETRDGSHQVGCAGGKGNGAAGGDVVLVS